MIPLGRRQTLKLLHQQAPLLCPDEESTSVLASFLLYTDQVSEGHQPSTACHMVPLCPHSQSLAQANGPDCPPKAPSPTLLSLKPRSPFPSPQQTLTSLRPRELQLGSTVQWRAGQPLTHTPLLSDQGTPRTQHKEVQQLVAFSLILEVLALSPQMHKTTGQRDATVVNLTESNPWAGL